MVFKILAEYGTMLLVAMGQTLLLALWSLFFACWIGFSVRRATGAIMAYQ